MRDLNRRNEFARKTPRGRYLSLTYSEAYALRKSGGEVYERVMPDHSYTPREKAQIPWTLVTDDEET